MPAFLLAAAIAAAPCASDPLIANPTLKILRSRERTFDYYVVTLHVKNDGREAQPPGTVQHLELVQHGNVLGKQPVPCWAWKRATWPRSAYGCPISPVVRLRGRVSVRARHTQCRARELQQSNDRLSATL